MNLKQQTIDTYNKTAKEMANKFNAIGTRVKDIQHAFSLAKKEDPIVLEIGCGNGRDAAEIVRHTKSYLGIDISSVMIDLAQGYVPEGKFIVADIDNYDFPEGIDLIFSFASLLHSDRDHVQDILRRAHAALNTDGIFFISLKMDAYQQKIQEDAFGLRVFYFYTPELIKEMAGKMYETIFLETQEHLGQQWFSIILRKK